MYHRVIPAPDLLTLYCPITGIEAGAVVALKLTELSKGETRH